MQDVSILLMDSTRRLLSELSERDASRTADAAHLSAGWLQIEEMGLPLAFVGEANGGLGLDQKTAFELVRMCGRHVLPYPVVETMLANRFAVAAGEALCEGPVASLDELTQTEHEFAALARAMQMAGALEAILSMTLSHVQERSQFGRPIAKFQAVQHSLALLASEVAAATAAADHAVGRFEEGADSTTLVIGIARARVGEACSKVSALAHQLHGAIGYTREHRLRHFTTSVWKWRDEFGTQAWWTRRVGQMVLARGRAEFWPMVTST